MNEYSKKQILQLIRNAKQIKEDVYVLNADNDLRIMLYDIECASKHLHNQEFKTLFSLLLNQYTINQIAKEFHTYERKIYRKINELTKELEYILNIRGI